MGQYRHHVFVCTSGKSCSKQGAESVHKSLKKLCEGRVVAAYRHVVPPGDNDDA